MSGGVKVSGVVCREREEERDDGGVKCIGYVRVAGQLNGIGYGRGRLDDTSGAEPFIVSVRVRDKAVRATRGAEVPFRTVSVRDGCARRVISVPSFHLCGC